MESSDQVLKTDAVARAYLRLGGYLCACCRTPVSACGWGEAEVDMFTRARTRVWCKACVAAGRVPLTKPLTALRFLTLEGERLGATRV